MCGSMVDIQFPTAESRRGRKEERRRKKEEERKKKPQDENIMACPKAVITMIITAMIATAYSSVLVYFCHVKTRATTHIALDLLRYTIQCLVRF